MGWVVRSYLSAPKNTPNTVSVTATRQTKVIISGFPPVFLRFLLVAIYYLSCCCIGFFFKRINIAVIFNAEIAFAFVIFRIVL